ncbi:Endoplasmic reticulum transmembrane protein 3 [Candida viswanathii]|uniref:Endoplasmic reticulum transmembrane protein n=1 Tax=Candida viswanathii TaxID=5486 RepID=A0A367YP34_9ASCO|nr:Endoplasmic reticulum transmembrane protein 3 [Candida viswanathii]
MALYYNLVFILLAVEMIFFGVLSLPYPRRVRRTILRAVSAPFRNEQFQIAIKCILGFVLVLFIDSVNRVYAVTSELHSATGAISSGGGAAVVNDRSEIQARRFYAQRNMYLCGFTLFLTFILTRTYNLVAELIATKDKVDDLKTAPAPKDSSEVAKLKKILAQKDEDLEILKSQAKNLSGEYATVSEVKVRK